MLTTFNSWFCNYLLFYVFQYVVNFYLAVYYKLYYYYCVMFKICIYNFVSLYSYICDDVSIIRLLLVKL